MKLVAFLTLFFTLPVAAQTDRFVVWNQTNAPAGAAEINRPALIAVLDDLKLDTKVIYPKEGKAITVGKVTMICPGGLRYIGENGIEVLAFDKLPFKLQEAFQWEPSMVAKYEAQKAARGQAAAQQIAKQRMQRIIADNAVHADNVGTLGATTPAITSKTVSQSKNSRTVGEVLREFAAKRWPGDFEMQEWLVDKQIKAYIELKKITADGIAGVPASTLDQIIIEARKDWYPEYDMVVWKIRKQAKAYLALQ